MAQDREIKRILWKCRRGTKELDLILGNFVRSNYQALSEADKQDFESLLEYEDPLLTEWLCFKVEPNIQGMEKIVARILFANQN